MSTLWTFGDSFTEEFNEKYPWADAYIKWKGYKPKVYGEILSEKLDVKLNNKGKGGSDNYTIFDTICDSVKLINDDDIIIIGWSSPNRFRLVSKDNRWKILLPNYTLLPTYNPTIEEIFNNNITKNTIEEIFINRNSDLYVNEVNKWIKLLNATFKKNVIIHWSPLMNGIDGMFISLLNRIKTETNDIINDGHFSEIGHIQIADIFLEKIHRKETKFI